jgi:hypothetical protein
MQNQDLDLGRVADLQNIGESLGQKVHLLRSFETVLPLPLVQPSFAKGYLMKAKLRGNVN